MFGKLQVVTLIASVALLAGCHAAPADKPFSESTPIEKGTDPTSQVNSESDLFLLAFNELGWNRRSSEISIKHLDRDSRDGCATYRKLSGVKFAIAQFNCERIEAVAGTGFTHRRTLAGREEYFRNAGYARMSSDFEQRMMLLSNGKLVGKGAITRSLQMTLPSKGSGSTLYDTSFSSAYRGDVASQSSRIGETWQMSMSSKWASSLLSGDYLQADSTLLLKHAAERKSVDAVRGEVLKLKATSDIVFNSDGSCLRPVGRFEFSYSENGDTRTGTLTTSVDGYVRSDEGSAVTPWGSRCLEK